MLLTINRASFRNMTNKSNLLGVRVARGYGNCWRLWQPLEAVAVSRLRELLEPSRKKYSLLRDNYFSKDSRIHNLHSKSLNLCSE